MMMINDMFNTQGSIENDGVAPAGKPSWPERGGANGVERCGVGIDNTLTWQ